MIAQRSLGSAARVVEHNALVFRRQWRGSITVSFFTPLFFIASMGIGLGSLVNKSSGGVGGVPYIDYLAPGLLAATAMQTAAFECTFPILGKILWDHIYDAMLATPLMVRDLVIGEVAWLTLRMLMVAAIFWVVMAVFGVAHTPESLLAIPAATLCGLAFATPLFAFTAAQKRPGDGDCVSPGHNPALPFRGVLSSRSAASRSCCSGWPGRRRCRMGLRCAADWYSALWARRRLGCTCWYWSSL